MADFTSLLHTTMPLAASLGMTAHEFTPDRTILELDWRQDLCTSNAVMHGGALMALADCAGAACAVQHLPEGATGTSTIESKTNFFGAVTAGSVLATARPLHAGATTIVVETEITNSGRLVAKTTQTQAVLG